MPKKRIPPKPEGETGIRTRWSSREWQWVYDVTYPRWSRGHLTLAAARIARNGMRADNDKGMLAKAPARLTVSDLVLKHWLPSKEAELTNRHSIAGAKTAAAHIVAGLGKITLRTLTPNDVERWKRQLVAKYASTTASLIFHRFKEVMKWAVEHEFIYRNVAVVVRAPKVTKHAPPRVSIDDIRRLLDVAEASPYGLPVYLAIRTGIREESELFGLTWAQIDLGEGSVRVAAKTPSGRRVVPLSPAVVERLRAHRQQQIADYFDRELPPPPHVMYDGKHRVWTTQRYWWRWNAIRTEAGFPELHFHDLRHFHASLLSTALVPVRVAQELLGHAHASTTIGTYTHPLGDAERAAAVAVEVLLDAPKQTLS